MKIESTDLCDRDPEGHNRRGLIQVSVSELSLSPGDPRSFSKEEIEQAMGFLRQAPREAVYPVVVNGKKEVLVGALLVLAARKLSLNALNVIQQEGLGAAEQKQYSIALNHLLAKGSWNPLALDLWVRELESDLEDFSFAAIGFEPGELDRALGMAELAVSSEDADSVPSVQTVPITKAGQIWQLGSHRVMCASAVNALDVERLMAGHRAKAAITDPPFGCKIDGFVTRKGLHPDFVEGAGDKSPAELEEFFQDFCKSLKTHTLAGGLVYIFIDWRSLDILLRAAQHELGRLMQMCCWVKDRAGMGSFYRSRHELVLVFKVPGGKHTNNVKLGVNGRNRSNVWEYPSAASSRSGREGDMLKQHPTPKSVEMIADAILDCTNRGDRVIDCFLGSGTALIAAERTGRICHGMELDPLYVDVAVRRWQAWTGKAALDVESGRTFEDMAAQAGLNDGGEGR